MQKSKPKRKIREPQHQSRPGFQFKMKPLPDVEPKKNTNKLNHKVAIVTGGDSGIGKAVSILFASEGADIAVVYLKEHTDAKDTKLHIEEKYGRKCLLIPGDISKEKFCLAAVQKTIKQFGKIDIL